MKKATTAALFLNPKSRVIIANLPQKISTTVGRDLDLSLLLTPLLRCLGRDGTSVR